MPNRLLVTSNIKICLSASLLVACLATSSATASAHSEYDSGVRYYQAGRYFEAVAWLERAALADPCNALIRYSLANALVKNKQHDRAVEEYKQAYLLDPNGQTGAYSCAALKAYGGKIAGAPSHNHSSVAIYSEVDRACESVRRQLQSEKLQAALKGQAAAASVDKVAQRKVSDVDSETAVVIANLHRDVIEVVDGAGRHKILRNPWHTVGVTPEMRMAEERRLRALAESEKKRILDDASVNRDRYAAWTKERELALDEVASNLTAQLTSNTGSGVQLYPYGTNLYVRQYVHIRGRNEKTGVQ